MKTVLFSKPKHIVINEKKKTTTVVFDTVFAVDVYETYMVEGKLVKGKFAGIKVDSEDVVKIARVAKDDVYDKYTGVAMILAANDIGSKTKLIKKAKEVDVSEEVYARMLMTEKCKTYAAFKEFVDNNAKVV